MIHCPFCEAPIYDVKEDEGLNGRCAVCKEQFAAIEKVPGWMCVDCAAKYEAEQMAALGRDSDGKPIATLQAVAG